MEYEVYPRTPVAPKGAFFFPEDSMPEKISCFAILVQDMRKSQKRYFETWNKSDLAPRSLKKGRLRVCYHL